MPSLPAVAAPMQNCGRLNRNSKKFAGGDDAALVIKAPLPMRRLLLLNPVTLDGLRGLVKDFAVFERAHQLDVFRMRLYQRACGARSLAKEQLAVGNVGCIPDLFGQEPAAI